MMTTGIVQEAYQQLHADVQHLITLQEAMHGSNAGNGKGGGIRSGSSHPKEKNSGANGECAIVSRARNQIQHQIAVLKRSILSVRLNNNGTSMGLPLASKVNLHSTSSSTNGNFSSPTPLGKLKHSFGGGRSRKGHHKDTSLETQRSRQDPLAAVTEGERTAHSHLAWSTESIARGSLGTSAFTKPVCGRSSTAPQLGVTTDGVSARLSSLSPFRPHLSETPDDHYGALARRSHPLVTAAGPSRRSSEGHHNALPMEKHSFESLSRLSIPPQIATTVSGVRENTGVSDGGAGKVKEVSFSGEMKSALSPSWGSDGEGTASATGKRKMVIHHVDHAAAQAAMKMRRGYAGFGSSGGAAAASAATTISPITGAAATAGTEANKGAQLFSPMLSSPSTLLSPVKKTFGSTEGSKGSKKKKVGKNVSFSKEKLLNKPAAGTSLLMDGSPDPLSPGLKMRVSDVTATANTATGALPIATLEASLAVVKECHEHATRFLHLGLCKDAKTLFLDSVSDDVTTLSRIAAAVVPTVDDKGRINGHAGGFMDGGPSGADRMKGNDEHRKGLGSKSGNSSQAKNQAKKTSVLPEEELPLALQAYHRAFQHELLTAVTSFYNILNNDPFLDTMAETVMSAARQVEVVVEILYRILSTPSLYAGNTPAVWGSCKMAALQPHLSVPGMASGPTSGFPLPSGGNASNRVETSIHGNLIVAAYVLSELLAVREEGVPTTSFPDGSQRQEKRYDVAESGYYMLLNGSIYVYEMSMYLLHRVENCLSGLNNSGSGGYHDAVILPVDGVEQGRKWSTTGGLSTSSRTTGNGRTSNPSSRTPHPAAEIAAALLPDLYRCCMRHVGACIEISDARQPYAMLKLATAKYLPWRLKMFDFLMQCMESMNMFMEANQIAQQAAHSVRFLLELECSDPVPPPPASLKVLEHAAQHTMLQMMRYGWYELIANTWRQRWAGTSGGEGSAQLGNLAEGGGSGTAFQAASPTGSMPSPGTVATFSSGAGGVALSGAASSTLSSSLSTVFTILPEHSPVSTVNLMPGHPSTVPHTAGGAPSTSSVALGEGYGVSVTVSFPHHGRELLDLIWSLIEKTSLPFALHQKKLDTSATVAAFAAASSVVNTGNTRGGHKRAGGSNTSGGAVTPAITMEQIEALKAARREEEVQHMHYMAQQFQRHILPFLIGFFVYHPFEMDISPSPLGIGSNHPMMGGGSSSGGFTADGVSSPEHFSKMLHGHLSSPGPTTPAMKSGGIGSHSSAKESNLLALLRFSHLRQCAIQALEILMQYMSIQYFKDPTHRSELLRGDTSLYPFLIPTAFFTEESVMRASTQAYLDEIQVKAVEEATAGTVVSTHSRSISPRNQGVVVKGGGVGGAASSGRGGGAAMNPKEMGSVSGGKRTEGGWSNEKLIASALQQLRTPPKEPVSITEDPEFIMTVQFENYFPTMWARNYQVQQRFKPSKQAIGFDATDTTGLPETRKTTQAFFPNNSVCSSVGSPSPHRANVEGRMGNSESTATISPATNATAGARRGPTVKDAVEDGGSKTSPTDYTSKTKKNGLAPILMGLTTNVSERGSTQSALPLSASSTTSTDRSMLLLPVEDELQKELLCLLQTIRHLYFTKSEALFYRCGAALDHFLRGTVTGHKGTVGITDFTNSSFSCGGTSSSPKSRSYSPPSGLPLLPSGGVAGAEGGGDGNGREWRKRGVSPSPTTGTVRPTSGASSSALSPTSEGRSKEAIPRPPRDGGATTSTFGETGFQNLSVASQLQWNRLVHSATCWIRLLESLRYSVLTIRFQKCTLQIDEVLLLGSYYIPPTHPLLHYFIRSGGYLPEVGRLVAQAKKTEVLEEQALQLAAMGGGGVHGKGNGKGSPVSAGRSEKSTHASRVSEREEGNTLTGQDGGVVGGGSEDLKTAARFRSPPPPTHPYPLVSPLLPAATALRVLAQVLAPSGASTRFFRENPLLGFHSSGSIAIAAVYEEVILSVGNFLIEAATESIQHRRKEKRARLQQGITALLFQDPEQPHMGTLSDTPPREGIAPSWTEKTGVQDFLSPLIDRAGFQLPKHGISSPGKYVASPMGASMVSIKPLRTEDEVDEEEERAYFDVVVNGISGLVASGLTNEMHVGEFAIRLANSALEDLSMAEERRRKESEEGKGSGGGVARSAVSIPASPGDGEKERDMDGVNPAEKFPGQMLNKTLLRPYSENGVADMVGPYLQKMDSNENGGGGAIEDDAAECGPLHFGALRLMEDVPGSRRTSNEVQTIKLLERSRLALSFVKTALSIITTRHRHFTESGILRSKRLHAPTATASKVALHPLGTTDARSGGGKHVGGEGNGIKGEGKKPCANSSASSVRPPAEESEAGGERAQTKEFPPTFYSSPPSKVFSVFREHAANQHLQEEKAVVLGNALRDYRTYLTRFVVELRYHVACLRAQVSVYEKYHEDIIRLLERHKNTKVFGAVTAKDARILQTLLSEEPELPETTEEEETKLLNWSGRDPALHALVLLCLANVLPSHRHRRERLDSAMDVLLSISHSLHHQPHPTDSYSLIIIWGFAASTSSTLRAMAHSSEAKKVLYQYYLCCSSSSFSSCFSAITTSYSERSSDLSGAEAVMKSYLHTNEKVIESSSELALLNFSGALMDLAAAEMETSRHRKNRIEKENPPEPYAVAMGTMSNWEWSRQHQITGLFSASSTLLALRLLQCISFSPAASRLTFPCVNLMFNCLLPCLSDKHFNTVVLLPLVSMAYVLLDFEGEGWQDAEVQLLALRILQVLKTHLALGGVAGRGMTLPEQRTQCALTQLLYSTFAHVWNRVLQFPNMRQRRYFQQVLLEGLRTRHVYADSVLIIQPEEDPEAMETAVEVVPGGRVKSKGASTTGSEKRGPSGGKETHPVKEPPAERAASPGAVEETAETAGPSPESFLFPGSAHVPCPSQPHVYDQVPVEFLELMEELLFHDPVMGCSILLVAGAGNGGGNTGSGSNRRAPAAAAAVAGGGGGLPTTGGGVNGMGVGRALGTSTATTGSHSPMGGGGSNGPSSRFHPASVSRSKHLVEDIESRVHLEKLLRPEPLVGMPPIIVETISTLGTCLSASYSSFSMSGSSSGTGAAGVGGSGGGSTGGSGAHLAPVADVLAKHHTDILYAKVVHRTMECLLRLEDFSTAKTIGYAAIETCRNLDGQIRQWLLRLHRGFFSWLALHGYILADSRRIQEEKEAEERRKALESKASKEPKSGRKSTNGRESKAKKNAEGEGKSRSVSKRGNKRAAISPRLESKSINAEDDVHFLDIPRTWNSAEEQMLKQTTRALGWIRRRRADRFLFRRLTAFNRLVSSQIRLYLAAITKLETVEIQRKRKYQEERWQHFHAKSLFGGEGGGGSHGSGHSHFQEGKLGANAGEKGSPFSLLPSASSRGIGSSAGNRKGAGLPTASFTEGSQEQSHPGYKVFTEHCANAAAILNNSFLSSQAMRAVCMAVSELQNGALENVPNAYLLAMREERHVDHSPSITSNNSLNEEPEKGDGQKPPLDAGSAKGSPYRSLSPQKANNGPSFTGKGSGSPLPTGVSKERSMSGEEKWERPQSRSASPIPMPILHSDLPPSLDEETMKRLQDLSPLLIRLATELLFSLTSIQRGYCDHRRDIEVIQPTAAKTGLFCCLAEQIHFQGFVPSLYAILSPAGQFEERRIARLAPREHEKAKRIKRRRLQECITAEDVSRGTCLKAYRKSVVAILNQWILHLPRLQKFREPLLYDVQEDSSEHFKNTLAENFLILHSQAHRNGDIYCTMDAHEAHATLRRAAMNCPSLVHFPFELPEAMKTTKEERIRQLQLGHDLPEEVIMEMIVFLASGMQFTAQRETLDLCSVANEITNHRFASVLLPIAMYIENSIGTHTADLYKAMDSIKNVVSTGKAALTTAQLNWKWYVGSTQYQRVLKRFFHSLFPHFSSTKKKDVREEYASGFRPSEVSENRKKMSIEEYHSNDSFTARSSIVPPSDAAFLGGSNVIHAKTVLSSYHRAASRLRESRDFGALSECLLELGQVYLLHRNKVEAEMTWLEALDAAVEIPRVLFNWRTTVLLAMPRGGPSSRLRSSSTSIPVQSSAAAPPTLATAVVGAGAPLVSSHGGQRMPSFPLTGRASPAGVQGVPFTSIFSAVEDALPHAPSFSVESIGITRLFMALCSLSSLAMFAYREDQEKAIDCYLLAASMVWFFFRRGASVNFPERLYDFMDFSMNDIVVTMYLEESVRPKIPLIVHHLLFLSHELQQIRYYSFAGMMGSLAEYMCMRYLQDPKLVIEARLIRAKAAAGGGNFGSAMRLLRRICQGAQLPTSLFSVLSVPSRSSVVDCSGTGNAPTEKSGGKGGGTASSIAAGAAASAAAGDGSASGGGYNSNPTTSHLPGALGAGGRSVGKDLERRVYNDEELPTSPGNVQSISTFVMDCFPHIYMDLSSGILSMQGGGSGVAGNSTSNAGGGSSGSGGASSTTGNTFSNSLSHATGGGATSTSASSNFLHEEVCERYGMLLSRRVVLAVAEILVMLGGREAAYLWPYDMSPVTGVAWTTAAASIPAGGGSTGASGAMSGSGSSGGGSSGGGGDTGSSARRSASRDVRPPRNSSGNTNSNYGGGGSGAAFIGGGGGGMTTGSGGGSWVPQRSACTEALKAGEFLLEPFLQKEVFHLSSPSTAISSTSTGKKSSGSGGVGGKGGAGLKQGGHSGIKSGLGAAMGGGSNIVLPGGAGATDFEQDSSFLAYQQRLEETGCLRHHATVLKAMAISERGHSRLAISLLEEEIREYNRSMRNKTSEVGNTSSGNAPTSGESRGGGVSPRRRSGELSPTHSSKVPRSAFAEATTTPSVRRNPPRKGTGNALPSEGPGAKKKTTVPPTPVGLGFSIEKFSNIPSFILAFSHTHWCRVWYVLTVNYFRLRAFRKMEKAAQQGILLCQRCNDPFLARLFSLYRAAALAQTGFLKEALETVKALEEATVKLSVGHADPYEAWSIMAVEWLKRMVLVQEGSGGAVAGGVSDLSSEGIWPTVLPLLQHYAEFCGLLPWRIEEDENNPNFFAWKVHKTSNTSVSACRAKESIKLHTVMNAAAAMKLNRYLGRKPPEESGASLSFTAGAHSHRSYTSSNASGGNALTSGQSKSKRKPLSSGVAGGASKGCGAMVVVSKSGGTLGGGPSLYHSPHHSPPGSPRFLKYGGGGGDGAGATSSSTYLVPSSWKVDLLPAIDLLEQAIQGLSSQYDTRAYPSLLVESKLSFAQALLLCRYPAQEDYGRGPSLLQSSVLPILQGDSLLGGGGQGDMGNEERRAASVPIPLLLTGGALHSRARKGSAERKLVDTPNQRDFPASEDLTGENNVTRVRQSKSVSTGRRESGDTEEGSRTPPPDRRSMPTSPGSSGKQRRKGGGRGASLASLSHSEESGARNSSSGGGGGGGMLSSQRVARSSSMTLSHRSSLPTSADVAESTLSRYIPVGRVQQICKLLLETAESTVSSGTHDFRVLRLALLELATLLSRYELPPSVSLPLEEEEEERESSGGSDSDSPYCRRRGSSSGSPMIGPLSAVAASCTLLAYLVQQMMHHVSNGANAFHIYNIEDSTITDSFSLQERFPDFVVAAIHSTISGVGKLNELSSTEHAVMEQPHRLSLDSPMTMTVSSFYTDLLVASGAEGAGSGKRGGGVGSANVASHSGTLTSNRVAGYTSAPPFMMMNDGNSVLPTSSSTTGNSISIYTPSPMPVTLQDIAHTFATLQRERGLYMLTPPQDALDHETALLQLKCYLQEKTTPPSCTYLYYPNELRRQCAKQLLLAKGGGGGLAETGGQGGGSAIASGGSGFRGGNKKDHLTVTQQQQQQDNMELWNALVPPLVFKTLPPFFFSPIGPDCLGASKINTVVTESFISASYDALRQGCDQMPGTEEAGMVTLLVSVSPYHDPSLTQPPSIATAADRKRLLVPMTRDLNSGRMSNSSGERASSSGSVGRATSSGSLGGGTQFKNRLAIAQVQLESRTVYVDGAFQDRLQELSQMDSSAGAGAHFGICGPGYDPENENSRKGLWTCVSFELPKKVVEELHRQALQVLRWYALEESDRRKHPECAAAAATGGAVGGGGMMGMKDIPFSSSPEGGGFTGSVGSPLGTAATNGSGSGNSFLSGKGQAPSSNSSNAYSSAHFHSPYSAGGTAGTLGYPVSGSGGLPTSGSAVGGPNPSGQLPTVSFGAHWSPATFTLYGALQQSLLSLQQKCQQQQLSHLMGGGGGTTKKGGGTGGAGGGSASGSSLGAGAPSVPKGLLGDTSAIFLTGLMNGANSYLSGAVGGGSILSSSAHGSGGGIGPSSGSTSERGSGGGSSVHFTLPGTVGGSLAPTGGISGSQGNIGNSSSAFLPHAYSGGGGSNIVSFSGGGVGAGSGGFGGSSFSCDLTERYYQQQQAVRMEESKRIIQRLDECKSLLLMNWIESIVKNYVARSMADEALMESCVQQLLPTCAFSNEVVEFLAHWLTNDGGSATFFHPGVHSWMRKISNFIVKMRRGSGQ